MNNSRLPKKQGLYEPSFEHDSCGVGFVCDIKGNKSRDIVQKGINVLRRMSHRGAVGSDPKTGDGAGILIQIPHKLYAKTCGAAGIKLPPEGSYGTGIFFLPKKPKERIFCERICGRILREESLELLGTRSVKTDNSSVGKTARITEPAIKQIFIAKPPHIKDRISFERKLYVARKRIEKAVEQSNLTQKSFFYITNLSCRTVSYKGLLTPEQLNKYYPELNDPDIESAIALVHSRYSTNTFPTWELAQPFRLLAHNGEINTLRGNINWFHARERLLKSPLFGEDLDKIKPIITEGKSDSAIIDNVFELLCLSGRPLEHSMMMLIPSAYEHDAGMDKKLREFFRYYACLMEPWDGPAAIAFTDGSSIGAVLDRNGLRPARYIITKDNLAVMASEIGVLDIDPANIEKSGRLEPGKMFFIDTKAGRVIEDSQIKSAISGLKPYGEWNKANILNLEDCPAGKEPVKETADILQTAKIFGYTREDIKILIKPMAQTGKEPVGSMGNDTPHAVLSKQPQLLYNYFKQLFAQVTNPPIDPIREKLVMSLESLIGSKKNILEETPEHSHRIAVKNPILSNEELEKIRSISVNSFKTITIPILYDASSASEIPKALERICLECEQAIEDDYSFIILSDRGVSEVKAAVPALLAVSAAHHHLVKKNMRSEATLILETAEPREVHHFAVLFGYGASCINPYFAYDLIKDMRAKSELELDAPAAIENYRKSVYDGLLKILSKMGISTLRSYRGAQIFEAFGLNYDVIEKYFPGTVCRIGGANIEAVFEESIGRHLKAFGCESERIPFLPTGGVYQWKKDGEFHLWNPDTIAALQDCARGGSYSKYKEFSELINNQSENPATLRSLLKFKKRKPVPIESVEPERKILKRFVSGAMSFGSISRGAHESIAMAMNALGGKSNTGEGGEDPARFQKMPNGDSARSAIKQVASGRFGVTTNYLTNADEIQIKIAQGAKPGEGGQLPGHKVNAVIARTRYTTAGVTLISPPPHHDIYSIEDLAQLIFDLKNTNPRARISVKLVSEVGVGTIAAGVAKGHADMILISGGDGGTGASPRSSIKHAGLPWELGLSETNQTLIMNDLRNRVRLQTDGQMRTAKDVAVAAMLGAEEYGFCTSILITLGCVMLRHCHLNNCSVGVATQDDLLQRRFQGKPEYIINYLTFVARELREIMASLGVKTLDELVGRTELLELDRSIIPKKAKNLDFSKILFKPKMPPSVARHCVRMQNHNIAKVLDKKLIKLAKEAVNKLRPVSITADISNSDRSVGAMLSGEVCRKHGEKYLPEGTINVKFTGTAGQSFGAFLAKGITFELEGLANDYVGKGISGGKIIIYPSKKSTYVAEENILIGNTTFYGAISGEAYIRGISGERFGIRNSGLYAVIEGVGDHACEYMTGGRVVILGSTGRNFGAGMSGGIAYVYDPKNIFKAKCNTDMVIFDRMEESDIQVIFNLLRNHHKYTLSSPADSVLNNFDAEIPKFVKVMPKEYKRLLESEKLQAKMNLGEALDG